MLNKRCILQRPPFTLEAIVRMLPKCRHFRNGNYRLCNNDLMTI